MGYCRTSTSRQDLQHQKLEVFSYANRIGLSVDGFIENTISSRKSVEERGIHRIYNEAEHGDLENLIVAELSRLGRSISEIIRIVDRVTESNVSIHLVKENIIISTDNQTLANKILLAVFAILAEVERDLISERTKSALAGLKAKGVQLGRPAGKSKLDPFEEEIRKLDTMGVRQKNLAEKFNCSEVTMCQWLKRKRKEWAKH